MNDKTKKWLKVFALIALVLVLAWAIGGKNRLSEKSGYMTMDEAAVSPNSLGSLSKRSATSEVYQKQASGVSAPVSSVENQSVDSLQQDQGDSVADPEQRKIVKNGFLSMNVGNVEKSVTDAVQIAKNSGGFASASNIQDNSFRTGDSSKSATVTLKVPSDKFETTMDQLKKIATQVVSESTNTDDITEAYIDLEAQIKNKQAEEAAFVRLLDQGGKIEDVLAVTKELSRTRGEIERLDARKRYYDSQTSLSQITVNFSEDSKIGPIDQDWRPFQVMKNAVKSLIKNMQSFIDGLIYFVIVKLPSLLVLAVVVYLGFLGTRKVYRKISSKP
jgi:hypothetical protein